MERALASAAGSITSYGKQARLAAKSPTAFAKQFTVVLPSRPLSLNQTAGSSHLQLNLLGAFRLVVDGSPVTGVHSERLQALVAFLVLHRQAPHSRQQIAIQLWPEASEVDAKANLRRRLYELKQLIPAGDRRLRLEPKTVQWVAGEDVQCDVVAFEAALARAKQMPNEAQQALEQAAALYQGVLLPSCYDDWIVPYRDHLQQQAISAVDALVTRLSGQGDSRRALDYAHQLLRLDPLYEPAYCHLMRLHAQAGDRASALRVYHQCLTRLQQELGVNPSPSTCQLYEELLTLEERPPPPTCTVLPAPLPQGTEGMPAPSAMPSAMPIDCRPALPLIGREAEWSALQQWRSRCLAQSSPPQVLWLVGEPGIGKTRLLAELATSAQANGEWVLWGRGFEAELLRPYGAWVDLFAAIGATAFLDELKALVLKVEAGMTLNRGQLFDRASQFLTQLAQTTPVLVILDDIQWVDETSIAFLHYAVRLLSPQVPVWFACAARQQEMAANLPADHWVQTLHRDHRICLVNLSPLDHDQTLALAQATGWSGDGDRLFAGSGGNPLFVLEMLRAQIQTEETSLEQLIQGRLRQLNAATRQLLPWAAALGRRFDPMTLATVAACPLPGLLSALEQLEQHGIIRPSSTIDGATSYDFAHDIVRQVAYQQLSEPRRCLIHTHIAQALNAVATPSTPLVNAVAHHADLGSDHTLAAQACLRAAERCVQVFAYAEATELSQRGLAHCQFLAAPQRLPLQLPLFRARVKAGVTKAHVTALRQDLQALIQEASDLGLTDAEAIGLEALIALNYDHGNLSEVQQYSLQAAERGRTASPATTVYLLAHSGACLAEIGREMSRAEALLLEAQAMGDRLGVQTSDIPFGLGCVHRFQGQQAVARSLLQQGWQMAQAAQDHWRECTCLINLVLLALETGNPRQALDYSSELQRVSAQMGGGSEVAHAVALEAVTQYLLQAKPATEALAQACQVLQQIDSPRLLADVQTLAAQWDLRQGNRHQAVGRAEAALEAAQRLNNPSAIALAWAVIIEASQQNGRLDCAQRHFADLKRRFSDCPLSAQAQQRLADLESRLKEQPPGSVGGP